VAEKWSTGLRNYLLGKGSFRKCFEDALINIYSGSAPASPDAAATGTLLVTLTKNAGAVSAGERSTPHRYKVNIASHAPGEIFQFDLTADGVASHITYTNTPDAGDADTVAKAIAQLINDVPQLDGIAEGANGNLYVKGRIDGLAVTLAKDVGATTGTMTVTEVEAAGRSDAIQFGPPASGVISKESNTWSGPLLAEGTAGYYRLVTSSDDGTLSTTQPRHQGTVSSSGAEINASSAVLRGIGAVITLESFSVTFPEA
jgi:hypothetical protein